MLLDIIMLAPDDCYWWMVDGFELINQALL